MEGCSVRGEPADDRVQIVEGSVVAIMTELIIVAMVDIQKY
jgi:hypothetical protein